MTDLAFTKVQAPALGGEYVVAHPAMVSVDMMRDQLMAQSSSEDQDALATDVMAAVCHRNTCISAANIASRLFPGGSDDLVQMFGVLFQYFSVEALGSSTNQIGARYTEVLRKASDSFFSLLVNCQTMGDKTATLLELWDDADDNPAVFATRAEIRFREFCNQCGSTNPKKKIFLDALVSGYGTEPGLTPTDSLRISECISVLNIDLDTLISQWNLSPSGFGVLRERLRNMCRLFSEEFLRRNIDRVCESIVKSVSGSLIMQDEIRIANGAAALGMEQTVIGALNSVMDDEREICNRLDDQTLPLGFCLVKLFVEPARVYAIVDRILDSKCGRDAFGIRAQELTELRAAVEVMQYMTSRPDGLFRMKSKEFRTRSQEFRRMFLKKNMIAIRSCADRCAVRTLMSLCHVEGLACELGLKENRVSFEKEFRRSDEYCKKLAESAGRRLRERQMSNPCLEMSRAPDGARTIVIGEGGRSRRESLRSLASDSTSSTRPSVQVSAAPEGSTERGDVLETIMSRMVESHEDQTRREREITEPRPVGQDEP